MALFKSFDHALEIYNNADPERVYVFYACFSCTRVTGTKKECIDKIRYFTKMDNEIDKWYPDDICDIEGWALLEVMNN